MKKMTRNEFLKMAGTSAALVVFNTVLMPAAVAVEPGVVALSSKKSSIEIDKGTTVNSATFKLVPISRETFWGDAGSCTLDYLSEGYTLSLILRVTCPSCLTSFLAKQKTVYLLCRVNGQG